MVALGAEPRALLRAPVNPVVSKRISHMDVRHSGSGTASGTPMNDGG